MPGSGAARRSLSGLKTLGPCGRHPVQLLPVHWKGTPGEPSAKIIAEDYQHDLHYFAPTELEEIAQEFQKEDFEILAGEEVEPEPPDLIETNKPEAPRHHRGPSGWNGMEADPNDQTLDLRRGE